MTQKGANLVCLIKILFSDEERQGLALKGYALSSISVPVPKKIGH
jgi:hypothetical protein